MSRKGILSLHPKPLLLKASLCQYPVLVQYPIARWRKDNCTQPFSLRGGYSKHGNLTIIHHSSVPSIPGKNRINYCNGYVQTKQNRTSFNENNPLGFVYRIT